MSERMSERTKCRPVPAAAIFRIRGKRPRSHPVGMGAGGCCMSGAAGVFGLAALIHIGFARFPDRAYN